MSHYYLNRNKEFVACEVLSESAYKREIKFLEGKEKGKTKFVHPKKVAWGGLFPRVFESKNTPANPFIFRGRVILDKGLKGNLIPKLKTATAFNLTWLTLLIQSIWVKIFS